MNNFYLTKEIKKTMPQNHTKKLKNDRKKGKKHNQWQSKQTRKKIKKEQNKYV